MSILVLTLIYWLSDIAVAFWVGGVLAVSLLFSTPLDVSPENITLIIHSASTPIELLDRLRPFQIGAGIILIASIVFGFIHERSNYRSVHWWIVWFLRSAAITGLIVVALYGAGDLRSRIKNIENLRDQLQHDLVAVAPSTQSQAESEHVETDSYKLATTYAQQLVSDTQAAYSEARATFIGWAWIEVVLGALVLLVSAYREASWRRKAERKESSADESPDDDSDVASAAAQPEVEVIVEKEDAKPKEASDSANENQ